MADPNAISGSTHSIFRLDQFPRLRKMELGQAHPIDLSAKQYELYFENTVVQSQNNFKFYNWSQFEPLYFQRKSMA